MLKYIQKGDFMQRFDKLSDMYNKIVKNIYDMYGNRDESIKNEIAIMNSRIEEVLEENNISARSKQLIVEKLLGETAENISNNLEIKREDTYSQMQSTTNKSYEEEQEIEEQGKTKARLEEQNEGSKISTTKLDDMLQNAISNAITYLARVGIPDEVLSEIKVNCGEIKNNTMSRIENEVDICDKGVKQLIEETLGEISKQTLVDIEKEDNPWKLTPEQENAFREGEQDVLEKYKTGQLSDNNTKDKEETDNLRWDDIF